MINQQKDLINKHRHRFAPGAFAVLGAKRTGTDAHRLAGGQVLDEQLRAIGVVAVLPYFRLALHIVLEGRFFAVLALYPFAQHLALCQRGFHHQASYHAGVALVAAAGPLRLIARRQDDGLVAIGHDVHVLGDDGQDVQHLVLGAVLDGRALRTVLHGLGLGGVELLKGGFEVIGGKGGEVPK